MTKQGNVYIMHSLSQNAYKIGESNNVGDRHSQGQTWVIDLEVMQTYSFPTKKVAQKKEDYIHLLFDSKRILKNREWFRLDSVDIIEIDMILNGGNRLSFFRRIYLKCRLKFLNLYKAFLNFS